MKALLLLLLCCSGCTSLIQKPYIKETTTDKSGTVTVREISADFIKNGSASAIAEKLNGK
jgi:hypothetical protein